MATDKITSAGLTEDIITGQTAESTIADDDLILISDTSASAALKKMTKANFVSGVGESNKPAFYATMGVQSNVGSGTYTKLQYGTEVVDTNSAYDPSSNYRFTVPSGEAGLYYFTAQAQVPGIDDGERAQIVFYLNGSSKAESMARSFSAGSDHTIYNTASSVFNLSVGDYVEVYVYHNEGSSQDSGYGQFGGFKVCSV